MKRFTPEDMKYINYVTWPIISNDGTRTAWVTYTGKEDDGSFPSKIYTGYSNGEKNVCLTENGNEKQPLFMSDGIRMLYLSDQSGEYQIYERNLATQNVRQITTLRHGVLRYMLSDDEKNLVFEAILWPEEIEEQTMFAEMNPEEKYAWEEELDWRPYYITDLTYKMDEWHGMRKGEYSHIGTVNIDGRNPRIINTNGMEAVFPSWSHGGNKIAFYGYPYTGAKGRRTELFVCSKEGGELCCLTSDAGISADHAPVFMKDDESVICMVYPMLEDGSCILLPYCVDLDEKSGRFLIDPSDDTTCHGVNPLAAGCLEYGDMPAYFALSDDGNYVYFLSGMHGRNGVYRVDISDKNNVKKVEKVITGEKNIQSFFMNKSGQIITTTATWTEPAEVYYEGKKLTESNAWLNDFSLANAEEIWIKSKDKKADLQYFLVHPYGEKKGETYPAVLYIKGGPETMYSLTFWHEFQAIAGAGMAVIFGNPRGSVGFGRAYCADGVCWEKEAMDDLLLFVEDAVSKGFIDKERIGVTGGSYGGYMTNKLIGRTKTFAAAVTQRCLANTATSYGTGDMGFVSSREIPKNFKMLDYLTNRARGNIISYIDQFKIPLLILHAYEDYRCGFEQAEQVFIAMKERNPEVPSRLVMFPGGNHGMTRTGKLYHQIRHLEELVNWFVCYLKEETGKDGGKDE